MPRRARPHPYSVQVTRYQLPDGTRCTRDTPGAVRVITHTDSYYGDVPGKGRVALKTCDEAVAWERLRQALKDAHDEALGIRDQYSVHAAAELAVHLEEWLDTLRAKGTGAEQIALVDGRLRRLFDLAGWTKLPQITGDSALKALARVQAPLPDGLGKSASTRNYYLSHLKAFTAWARDGGRLRGNPVRRLSPVNTETDRRHDRRSPTTEEVAALFAWLNKPDSPVCKRLCPAERKLGYEVAMATGFRAGELRSLSPASFDLDAATATVAAGYSKHRRTDVQRLPAWLVSELRAWFEGGMVWGWSRLNKAGPGKVLKADLRDARAAWIEAAEGEERERRLQSDFLRGEVNGPTGPLFWDFHSFRHWYCTQVGNQPGMDLKTLLSLTRHSTAALALQRYARSQEQRIREAVEQIPPPPAPPTPNP